MSEYHPNELPEPPPMRIGEKGDTIGRDRIRRKADGSIRVASRVNLNVIGLAITVAGMLCAVFGFGVLGIALCSGAAGFTFASLLVGK